MQVTLGTVDLCIVAAYCLGILFLGFWFSRRQRDTRAYLLGNKEVAWWMVLISIAATETSTVTFLSVTGKGFGAWNETTQTYQPGNLTFLQLALGYIIGRALIAWWLVPQYFRGELFTAYQVLEQRFGPSVQKTASAIFLVTRTIADGLRLYLAGLFLSGCMGWSMEWSIFIVGVITLVYTFLGGIKAILWTDVIQFAIKVGGAVVVLILIVQILPGGWQQFWNDATQTGQTRMFDFQFDWPIVQTFWAGLIGGAFLTMATHGADQMMVQRYLCSKSLSQARLALVSSGVVIFLQFLLFLAVGIGFYLLMNAGLFAVPPQTPADKVFALFLASDFMPIGLRGLIVAAVFAAAMSTLSASWNSAASTVVYDFYKPLRSHQTEKHYLHTAKFVTLLAGILQMGIAWLAVSLMRERSIVDTVLEVAGLALGLLLGLFVLGSMKRPVQSRSALAGLVAGLIAVNVLYWMKYWGYPVAWPWYTPAGTLTTVLAGLLAECLFPRSLTQEPTQRASA